MIMLKWTQKWIQFDWWLLWLVWLWLAFAGTAATKEQRSYYLIGVSGGLQDGFPAHTKLDYHSGQFDESKALFLGKGLVRGYKAFLDVMQEGWREYAPEPEQPVVNSNVFASGCHEHANEYWLYFVDSRQAMLILNNEPRFLSITPDTGMIHLHQNGTDANVEQFLLLQAQLQFKSNTNQVAVPLVTAVWFNPLSHVPSPILRTLDDGTQVTNFPDSLALWAQVNDADRTAVFDDQHQCLNQVCESLPSQTALQAQQRYWDGIRNAVRHAELNRPLTTVDYGPPFKCQNFTRFGVDNHTARVTLPKTAIELQFELNKIGLQADFDAGEIYSLNESS